MAMKHIREKWLPNYKQGMAKNLLSIIKCRLSYEEEKKKTTEKPFQHFTKRREKKTEICPFVNLDIVLSENVMRLFRVRQPSIHHVP